MSKESYIRGFVKKAESAGVDPVKLAQFTIPHEGAHTLTGTGTPHGNAAAKTGGKMPTSADLSFLRGFSRGAFTPHRSIFDGHLAPGAVGGAMNPSRPGPKAGGWRQRILEEYAKPEASKTARPKAIQGFTTLAPAGYGGERVNLSR